MLNAEFERSKLHVIARRAPWSNRIEIAAFAQDGEGGKAALGQLVMTEADPRLEITPACLLNMTQAQELMDTLYQAGVRPTTAAENPAAALKATENHLKDMQVLLGKQLEVKLG